MHAQADPYRDWLARLAALLEADLPVPPPAAAPGVATGPAADPAAPLCLLLSPHPDDECIVGALPLRLRQERGWRVLNCAVTLGSRQDRREARLAELRQAAEITRPGQKEAPAAGSGDPPSGAEAAGQASGG